MIKQTSSFLTVTSIGKIPSLKTPASCALAAFCESLRQTRPAVVCSY